MNSEFSKYIERELLSEQEIAEQVKKVAEMIEASAKADSIGCNCAESNCAESNCVTDKVCEDKEKPLLIGILTGGFVFLADLMRQLSFPCEVDFIAASSYGDSTQTNGNVQIIKDIACDVVGKHVIIVEDLIDTGITLREIKKLIQQKGAAKVEICALLDKPSRRIAEVKADYPTLEIPNEFVVGYGLDYAGRFRNYRGIAILKREVVGG